MKKKYRKPTMLKKMKNHIHGGACGTCDGCGKLVAMY